MISNQQSLNLSPFMAIYDIVVPKDNMLRQINASSSGLIGMQMQGAMAIFSVNLKRIINLMKESK
jgi:hypothetical protein